MNDTLFQALAQLNLQPGQCQRVQVNGCEFEIRRPAPDNSGATSGEGAMLEPWVWFPDAQPIATFTVRSGTHPLPDPPVIPSDEEEPA